MLAFFTILYLSLTVAAGIYTSGKINVAEDFALAGRRLPFHLSLTAFFATWFGAETILGASAQFAKDGFKGIIEDPFGASLCLVITGLVFVKCFYPKGYLSIGDFFRERYGRSVEFATSLLQALSYFTYSAAQFVALAIVLETVTGFDFSICLISGAILVVTYTYFGGMWALAFTDFVQAIVIIAGLGILTYYLWKLLPISFALSALLPANNSFLPQNSFSGWAEFSAAWMIMGFGSIPSQDIFQRIMSAKSEKVARNSAIIAGMLYLVIAILPLLIVMLCLKIYGNQNSINPQQIIPQMVLIHMPMPVQVLFFGALLSAILSTASASLLAQATVIGENLIKPQLKSIKNKQFLNLLRFLVVCVSVISVIIALNLTNIFLLSSISSSLILVSLFIPMIGGLWVKKSTGINAWSSMISGILVYSICLFLQMGLLAVFWGFVASIAGFLLGFIHKLLKSNNNLIKNDSLIHSKSIIPKIVIRKSEIVN